MIKKTNKIIALLLAIILSFSALPFTAFASSVGSNSSDTSVGADDTQNAKTAYAENQISTENVTTGVYLTIDNSDIIASVPTSIIVSGTPDENGNYIGEYSISASGDIAGNKVIQIKPNDNEIELVQKGKSSKTAIINQSETTFNFKELTEGVIKNGKVTANSLSAGSWNAKAEFTLSVIDTPILDGYSTLYEYDLSETENDDVKAYYCVPNKNTKPVDIVTTKAKSKMSKAASNAESTITYNGIQYSLSDEDTLVISGTGKMKENVQSELIDYASFYKDIIVNYNVIIMFGIDKNLYIDENNNLKLYSQEEACNIDAPVIRFSAYGLSPIINNTSQTVSYEKVKEIEEFCKSYSDYAISMPKTLIVKTGVENISRNAFNQCLSLENVIIEYGVKSIDYFAFNNCKNLISINIPESVTELGNQCFSGCENLVRLTIPNSVKIIGSNFCQGCKKLEYCKMPNAIDKLGSYAFGSCHSLTEIVLPENITKIPLGAFSGCRSLKEINLPTSVKEISMNAFEGCDALTKIIIPNSVTTIGANIFYDCDALQEVYIPSSVTRIDGLGARINKNVVIYCENQSVADLASAHNDYIIVVAPELF